jgi:hypothetical protein
VFSHSPEIIRLLLEHGADSNKGIWPHFDATTPFIMAKERGYEDIAQVFLEDESVEIQPPEEFLAVVHDESATIAFLERHAEYIRVPFYRMALLYSAAARLWPRLLNWLLDHGADPNLTNPHVPSPLEAAGRHGKDPLLTQQIVRHSSVAAQK